VDIPGTALTYVKLRFGSSFPINKAKCIFRVDQIENCREYHSKTPLFRNENTVLLKRHKNMFSNVCKWDSLKASSETWHFSVTTVWGITDRHLQSIMRECLSNV